jgi:hypothetical protein
MDFRQAGEIVDDDLNRALVNPLPQARCQAGSGLEGVFAAALLLGDGVLRPLIARSLAHAARPPPNVLCPLQGVKLHCVIDACHSGSAMDLPFQAHVRGGYAQWEPTFHYTRVHKGTAGGFAVQFSAAKDSQTAADTQALAGGCVGAPVVAVAGRRWRIVVLHWQGT